MAKVKLTNSVTIDSTSLSYGMNMSNVLAQLSVKQKTTSFTAPADCWVFFSVLTGNLERCRIYIDNVQVFIKRESYNTANWSTGSHNDITTLIPLKKGQVLKTDMSENNYDMSFGYKVYGTK